MCECVCVEGGGRFPDGSVRVAGPVRVIDEGGELVLPAARQIIILAALIHLRRRYEDYEEAAEASASRTKSVCVCVWGGRNVIRMHVCSPRCSPGNQLGCGGLQVHVFFLADV